MGHNLTSRDLEDIGGLENMRIMNCWPCVDISVSQNSYDDWHDTMDKVIAETELFTQKRISVLLSREDEMSDKTAYFAIFCEDDDDARAVMAFFQTATMRARREPVDPGPLPEWLVRFSTEAQKT